MTFIGDILGFICGILLFGMIVPTVSASVLVGVWVVVKGIKELKCAREQADADAKLYGICFVAAGICHPAVLLILAAREFSSGGDFSIITVNALGLVSLLVWATIFIFGGSR